MKLTQERYKNLDRLLGEIVNGMTSVAILGASIILLASLWGIYYGQFLPEKLIELSQTIISFSPVP